MLTSTILSNISYNTDIFLEKQLNELLKGHQISFWCYIKHQPEDQELKEHKHLLIIPDTRIDTVALDDHFLEPDPNNDLPLKCMLWTKTKCIYDWFLYGVHDSVYCKLKYAEDKKIHYTVKDFVFSNLDIFNDFWFKSYHEYDFWKSTKYRKFIEMGWSCKDIVKRGYVDLNEMVNFHYFAKMCDDII